MTTLPSFVRCCIEFFRETECVCVFLHCKKLNHIRAEASGPREKAHRVKVLAAKFDGLNSIPQDPCDRGREMTPAGCLLLTLTCALWCTRALNKQEDEFLKIWLSNLPCGLETWKNSSASEV